MTKCLSSPTLNQEFDFVVTIITDPSMTTAYTNLTFRCLGNFIQRKKDNDTLGCKRVTFIVLNANAIFDG